MIRSPARSHATRSRRSSHSGVAYSGWNPVSTYRRAPFGRKRFGTIAKVAKSSKRCRASTSAVNVTLPFSVHVRPYSLSRPKMRRFTPWITASLVPSLSRVGASKHPRQRVVVATSLRWAPLAIPLHPRAVGRIRRRLASHRETYLHAREDLRNETL